MMKKNGIFVAAVVLAMSMALASCGGNGPKPLARQTYRLMQETEKVGDDMKKMASLAARALKLEKKVDNLSEAKTVIYEEELLRLMSGGSASSGSSTTSSGGTKYATAQKDADFTYDLTADGTGVVITGLNKPAAGYYNVIKIPAKLEGYPVVEVRELRSYNADYLASGTSVTFPDTVTVLGENLLDSRVTSVKLPPKITVIPNLLFQSSKITEITIPNGVTRIESQAFQYCEQLTTVTIPDSVTEIMSSAFRGCSELTTVKLPAHPIQYTNPAVDYYDGPDDAVVRKWEDEYSTHYSVLDPDNGAFSGCGKLSLAMRKAITDSGYGGSF
jgi:hypothetical protein